jgi:hypothetical protein
MEEQKSRISKTIILGLVLYFLSTGVSFAAFSYLKSPPVIVITSPLAPEEIGPSEGRSKFRFDPNAPKTEPNPLNGILYSKEKMAYLAKRRPLAVMVENHTDARPQSGLSGADVVYEAVAEGGITRFLAVYFGVFDDFIVGPIRSARVYFLDWMLEYNALYAHVGGANTPGPANALGQILELDVKSLNQFYVGFPTYWRDYERLGRQVATEHTVYSTPDKLWQKAEEQGWEAVDSEGESWDENFVSWKFKEDAPLLKRPENQSIEFNFWEGYREYLVRWEYDKASNSYKRLNGGEVHKDLNNGQQLAAKNVVIQFVNERSANDGYPGNVHLLYGTIGGGKAIVFRDGEEILGRWEKEERTARTIFYDQEGGEITFDQGLIWIEIVPTGTEVNIS